MALPKLNFGSLAARGGDDEDDHGAPRRSTEEDEDVDMTGFSATLKKTAAAGKGDDDDPTTSSAGESSSDEYEDYDARAAAADALARASASFQPLKRWYKYSLISASLPSAACSFPWRPSVRMRSSRALDSRAGSATGFPR